MVGRSESSPGQPRGGQATGSTEANEENTRRYQKEKGASLEQRYPGDEIFYSTAFILHSGPDQARWTLASSSVQVGVIRGWLAQTGIRMGLGASTCRTKGARLDKSAPFGWGSPHIYTCAGMFLQAPGEWETRSRCGGVVDSWSAGKAFVVPGVTVIVVRQLASSQFTHRFNCVKTRACPRT